VWLLYRILQGEAALAVPAAIWIAIAGGLRPQTQLFLMPLALVAGWRLGWKRGLLALGVMAVVDFAWAIPLVWSTGGLARYLQVTREFTAAFNTTTSVFSGGVVGSAEERAQAGDVHAVRLGPGGDPGGAVGLKAMLLVVSPPAGDRAGGRPARQRPFRCGSDRCDEGYAILGNGALACAGARLLRSHSHGQQGLVFVFLPALLLLSAAGCIKSGHERSTNVCSSRLW